MLNPTDCEALQIGATVTGEHPLGSTEAPKSAQLASAFAAAGCRNLPFKPSLRALTQARTSGEDGASLRVVVAQKPGEANIRALDLQLPLALPSRSSTLKQACGEAQFAANPAACPPDSVIGTATVHTPLLVSALRGPAYLVSHGGAAFPDVVFVLQAVERGGLVTIELVGNTDIKKGITYSKFQTLPDAPIESVEANLPEGPHSVLAANGSLCEHTALVTVKQRVTVRRKGRLVQVPRAIRERIATPLLMPTTIIAQNGARVTQDTQLSVSGCRTLAITTRKLSGSSLALALHLSRAGTVTVSGPGLRSYRRRLGAGAREIEVGLSSRGLSARRSHRRIEVRVALHSGGKTYTSSTSLRL